MNINTINYIKNNPLIYNYLREDSSWYKELNRGNNVLPMIEEIAKKYYKETQEDKLKRISENIGLVSAFMDVLK